MRARIRKDPLSDDVWSVEVKFWWSGWLERTCYSGEKAQDQAMRAAHLYRFPYIIEVEL